MVMGIIGKTHGVKIARKPKPNAASRKIPRSSEFAGVAAPSWCPISRGLGLAIARRDCQCRRGSRGVDHQRCNGTALHGRDAQLIAAYLVANFGADFSGTGGRVLLQRNIQQEDHVAFVGLGVQIEIGIEGALGLRLENALAFHRSRVEQANRGGDRAAFGRREGIQMPARRRSCPPAAPKPSTLEPPWRVQSQATTRPGSAPAPSRPVESPLRETPLSSVYSTELSALGHCNFGPTLKFGLDALVDLPARKLGRHPDGVLEWRWRWSFHGK